MKVQNSIILNCHPAKFLVASAVLNLNKRALLDFQAKIATWRKHMQSLFARKRDISHFESNVVEFCYDCKSLSVTHTSSFAVLFCCKCGVYSFLDPVADIS